MDFQTGRFKDFYWFESSNVQVSIDVLLKFFPNIFLNKYLAVTALDSGEHTLVDEEVQMGWTTRNRVAYSPLITTEVLAGISSAGFDEWYLLETSVQFIPSDVFVNYAAFTLSDFHQRTSDNTTPASNDDYTTRRLQGDFWKQVENIDPYAVIMEGCITIIVSKDASLIARLEKHFS